MTELGRQDSLESPKSRGSMESLSLSLSLDSLDPIILWRYFPEKKAETDCCLGLTYVRRAEAVK